MTTGRKLSTEEELAKSEEKLAAAYKIPILALLIGKWQHADNIMYGRFTTLLAFEAVTTSSAIISSQWINQSGHSPTSALVAAAFVILSAIAWATQSLMKRDRAIRNAYNVPIVEHMIALELLSAAEVPNPNGASIDEDDDPTQLVAPTPSTIQRQQQAGK